MTTQVQSEAPTKRDPLRTIPAVLAAHFEELASLWAIRQEHVRGPDWNLGDVAVWDTRLSSHVQGLLVAGDEAIPILEEHLASDDPTSVFAAAFVLLQMNAASAAERVLHAIETAQGPQLLGLADALFAGPIDQIELRLRELASKGLPPQSLLAFLALATHGRPVPKFVVTDEALHSDDPHVRQLAWRCIAHLPAQT